jgi:diketogulonate reductase-like aldo/keto reductase
MVTIFGRLDIGYIDLLLMHSPGTATVSTWKAIAKLKEQGVCKSIGVSNFGVHHLVELQKATSILPTGKFKGLLLLQCFI